MSVGKSDRIFVAGHRGLVGSAIMRLFKAEGFENVLVRERAELDLTDTAAVAGFFAKEKPAVVILAAAKVGGIKANNDFPVEFLLDNLRIQNNVVPAAFEHGTRKLLFLGSSCIYPKDAPQPISESALLSGPLEPTNEAYAVAKIAGVKLCQAYARQYGANFISAMPTNLYGSDDNFDLETSRSLRGAPSGFVLSQLRSPLKPTTSQINSASSRMEMSSPHPTLIISGASYFWSRNRQAAAQSST